MEAVSTSHRVDQLIESSRRVDILSLGIAFVKEIQERDLSPDQVRGLLKLTEKLLKKEKLL